MTTPAERTVLDHLALAWAAFLTLDEPHPDDLAEFRHSIHALQKGVLEAVVKELISVNLKASDLPPSNNATLRP